MTHAWRGAWKERWNMPSHHDHEIPERTTPQGTQLGGPEFGHEEKDVNFAPVFRWFLSLLVVTVLTQVMLAGALTAWVKNKERHEVLPSNLYSVRQVPPEPRLLPNPVDSPVTSQTPIRGPMETLAL